MPDIYDQIAAETHKRLCAADEQALLADMRDLNAAVEQIANGVVHERVRVRWWSALCHPILASKFVWWRHRNRGVSDG